MVLRVTDGPGGTADLLPFDRGRRILGPMA